ncbi:cytochrome P450 1A1-like [Ostrea edulis]|uniref:cytochrome P450 1A1-like n=1 Tax=Ostrea edulis TaxID=37623 RepID=UPI0024AFB42F|nr:cytochrome P450 1A1-like [Ostrea edulis]
MLNFILIAILIILSLYYVVRKTGRQKGKGPPGPKGWPVFQIFLGSELPTLHLKLYDWTEKYGDIFQFEFVGKKFISLNSSEVLREAFTKEENSTITSFRPPTFTGEYLLDNYADVGFASPDPLWTKRRKLYYQLIRSYGEGLSIIESQIKENLQSMKKDIRSTGNRNVDPSSIVEEFILNTVEVLVIGRSFGRKGELQKILRKLDHLVNIITNPGYDILYGFLPFLRFLPLPMSLKMNEFRRTKQVMVDYLETLSKEETMEKGIYHTLKDVMKERDEHGNQWFTQENLSNLLVNLVAAGYLTTRGTVMSMIQILAKRPELQKALQREMDNVIGFDREPCLDDRHKCPLTEAVILETLRYISHVPLAIFHATSQETTIAGYTIEKNTVIIPNLWTMHLREKEWEQPFTFKPERFLDADGLLLPANDPVRKKFCAFGTGKRNCIGEVFAKSRIFLFLSTLMQQTTIFEPDGKSIPDLRQREMLPGIVLQPQPYEVRFVLRQKKWNTVSNVNVSQGSYYTTDAFL